MAAHRPPSSCWQRQKDTGNTCATFKPHPPAQGRPLPLSLPWESALPMDHTSSGKPHPPYLSAVVSLCLCCAVLLPSALTVQPSLVSSSAWLLPPHPSRVWWSCVAGVWTLLTTQLTQNTITPLACMATTAQCWPRPPHHMAPSSSRLAVRVLGSKGHCCRHLSLPSPFNCRCMRRGRRMNPLCTVSQPLPSTLPAPPPHPP